MTTTEYMAAALAQALPTSGDYYVVKRQLPDSHSTGEVHHWPACGIKVMFLEDEVRIVRIA